MKNNFIKILALASVVMLSSCTYEKLSYDYKPFVSFSSTNATVNEDEGIVKLPITVYNCKSEVTVSLKVTPGSLTKAGEDYEILGLSESGTLKLTSSIPSDTIQIKVLPHVGKYTGNKSLKVTVVNTTTGTSIGTLSEFNLTILDRDIPVDWDFFAGKWKANDYTMTGGADGSAYTVIIAKVDETHFTMTNLWGGASTLNGTVEFDEATNTASISIDGKQVGYTSKTYGPCWFLWFNGSSLSTRAIPGKVTGEGITVGDPDQGIGYYVYITSGTYKGYGLNDGDYTKMSK